MSVGVGETVGVAVDASGRSNRAIDLDGLESRCGRNHMTIANTMTITTMSTMRKESMAALDIGVFYQTQPCHWLKITLNLTRSSPML